jgi:hypothetical protein
MPIQPINIITEEATPKEVINEIAKLQKILRYLLTGGLDTENVNELSADVINTGVLNANLVTIRSDLTGSYIEMDEEGLYAFEETTGFSLLLNGKGFTSYDDLGVARISLDITAQSWGAANPAQLKFLSGGATSGIVGTNTQGDFYMGVASERTLLFGNPIQLESNGQRIDLLGNLNETSIRGFTKFYDNVTFSVGNVSFTGSISGLSTSVISDHNHGVTPGRYIQTYDSAGNVLGLQVWNASGGHSHSIGVG